MLEFLAGLIVGIITGAVMLAITAIKFSDVSIDTKTTN